MKKIIRYLSVVGSFLLVVSIASQISPTVTLAEEIYYFNDFEENDDVEFCGCGNPYCGDFAKAQNERYFIFNSKGLVKEKAYSGASSLKLDIIPDKGPEKGVWNYWRSPRLNIPLSKDKPIHFSGYLYLAEVPKNTIFVRFGLSFRFKKKDGKYSHGSCSSISAADSSVAGGWLFQQVDIYEFAKNTAKKGGFDEEDMLLECWYIRISSLSPEGFHGERIIIYVDDVKIGSEK